MGDWKQELGEILEDETDTGKNMIPKYARCYAKIILENFIERELSKAREEVVREIYNFVESESGKSGRKEILEFISKLTTK